MQTRNNDVRALIKDTKLGGEPNIQIVKSKMKKRIYIAGKLSADTPIGYIQNMHRMINTAKEVRDAGYSVYCPANDFLEGLVDGHFDYSAYFDNSQPWLLASDAVVLVPGWETSPGTKRELDLAAENNIPIYASVKALVFDDKMKWMLNPKLNLQ